jgi:hypothetical protein
MIKVGVAAVPSVRVWKAVPWIDAAPLLGIRRNYPGDLLPSPAFVRRVSRTPAHPSPFSAPSANDGRQILLDRCNGIIFGGLASISIRRIVPIEQFTSFTGDQRNGPADIVPEPPWY